MTWTGNWRSVIQSTASGGETDTGGLYTCSLISRPHPLPELSNANRQCSVTLFTVYHRANAAVPACALCLECRVSWVRVPPEVVHFFLGKVTALGVCYVALPCCLFDLACFFLPSFSSLIKTCIMIVIIVYDIIMYYNIHVIICVIYLWLKVG